MPNNQTKSPSPAQSFRTRHRRLYRSFLVLWIVIVAGTAAFAIWQHQNDSAIAADKARFEQADKDVRLIAAEIQKQYPPAKQDYSKSCRQTRAGYEKPKLNCKTVFMAGYEVDDYAEGNKIKNEIEKLINDKVNGLMPTTQLTEKNGGIPEFSALPIAPNKEQALGEAYIDQGSKLECSVTYGYFNPLSPPGYYLPVSIESSHNLAVTIDCYGEAKSSVFPLDN